MNILILGATGFIGKNILLSLSHDHRIIAASRKNTADFPLWRKVDFTGKNNWDEILEGVEMVINAIGIIEGDFQKIQTDAPLQLLNACEQKNIRLLNISAIGAEKEKPLTEFLQTKKSADEKILAYKNGKVVYAGIVLGSEGKSSQMFASLAKLPFIPLPSDNLLSFTHISQLCGLIKDITERFNDFPKQIFAVAEPEKLSAILSAMKGRKVRCMKIPVGLVSFLFAIFPKASIGIFNKNSFLLFRKLNSADYKPMFSKASELIEAGSIKGENIFAPILALLSIVFIWIWSGVSSLVNSEESFRLMHEIGANEIISALAIYAGSAADIILGIGVIGKKYRKQILLLQMMLVLVYTIILSVFAPHYWLHPFGILSKNIPLLALSYFLFVKED